MYKKIAFAFGVAAAVSATPALAAGQQATGTVDVLLQVSNSCSVKAQPLNFGTLTDFSQALSGSSATKVNCTPGAPYTVFVDYGQNAGAGSQRKLKMTDASNNSYFIDYKVFTASGGAVEWTPSVGVSGTGNGSDQDMTLWGSVPSQASKPAGSYSDQLVVTLNY